MGNVGCVHFGWHVEAQIYMHRRVVIYDRRKDVSKVGDSLLEEGENFNYLQMGVVVSLWL